MSSTSSLQNHVLNYNYPKYGESKRRITSTKRVQSALKRPNRT